MSLRKRFHIKQEQKLKRRKNRTTITTKGLNPNEYYYGKFFIKAQSTST